MALAIVKILDDTDVEGGVLTAKGTHEPVHVSSADFSLGADGDMLTTASGRTRGVRVETALHPHPLSSGAPNKYLRGDRPGPAPSSTSPLPCACFAHVPSLASSRPRLS